VSSWIESRLKIRINLETVDMLFGVKSENKFSSVLNCLLLQARFLIFRCKVAKQTSNMHMYLLLIKNIKLAEKKNCTKPR